MVKDLTKGKSMKLILTFCLPLMAGQLFQQFYNMVDSIIVGKFAGTAELSAVGSTGALNFMVIGFASGLGAGLAIPVSQCFGAGDLKKMRKFFINAIYLTLITSVIMTGITVVCTRPMLKLMNTPDDIIDMAYTYISIVFAGLTAIMFYNLSACMMRAIGDSKTPLYLLIFSSVLNIILDLIFVVKFGMSVKGVAIATVIAQAVAAVVSLLLIRYKFKVLCVQKDERSFNGKLCLRLLYMGIPMALQFSITAIGSIMLQSAVNQLGSAVIAAITVGGKIQLMLIVPAESIGLTMATYCGQNLGAGKIDRIRDGMKKSFLIAMIYGVVAILVARLFGDTMSLLFVDRTQTDIIGFVSQFLATCSYFYPVLIILYIFRNAIQGLGYSVPAMLAGVFELVARGVMSYLIIPKTGYSGACFANPAAWVAADIFLIPAYIIIFRLLKKRFENKWEETHRSEMLPLNTK